MWRQRQHLTGTQQLRIIITNAKNIHDDQEPYSKNACERALENHGNYVAGINAFWVNHLRSPTPGIPLRRESVKELADFCGLRRTQRLQLFCWNFWKYRRLSPSQTSPANCT